MSCAWISAGSWPASHVGDELSRVPVMILIFGRFDPV
jgi:hypothetical protein